VDDASAATTRRHRASSSTSSQHWLVLIMDTEVEQSSTAFLNAPNGIASVKVYQVIRALEKDIAVSCHKFVYGPLAKFETLCR
jgi:hypothetical protein